MEKTGFRGTFVISWSQTEIDGVQPAPVSRLTPGASWCWYGTAIRVDGPNDILSLDRAAGADALRKRAAHMVQRLVGRAFEAAPEEVVELVQENPADDPLMDDSFVLTDGRTTYAVTLITLPEGPPLLMFHDTIPPVRRDLWIVNRTQVKPASERGTVDEGGVICFTPGTGIRTPQGVRPIEMLRKGDLVQTKDNGAQRIAWVGTRHMSGARLFVMPALRPVRIRTGFFGKHRPDADLLVSPAHRIVLKGAAAHELFNTPEVLVTARDLIDGRHVTVDLGQREVTYVHLMLDSHQVVWANGVETESFHPASAAWGALAAQDRRRLLRVRPELADDPYNYGAYARRNLTASEAAIYRYAA